MGECIFCGIIAGEKPAEIIFENDSAVAILDVNPIHFGHSLIIPRTHCVDFTTLPSRSFEGVMEALQVVARATVESLNIEGYNVFSNNGAVAGQSVFHLHFHVTPRYPNDNIRFELKLKKYTDGQMSQIAGAIRNSIIRITKSEQEQ